MTAKKQELCNIIETLPDELSIKVLDYIEYLKFISVVSSAPDSITVKDKKDLREKLEEGIKDTNNGNICSIEEAFTEVDEILNN